MIIFKNKIVDITERTFNSALNYSILEIKKRAGYLLLFSLIASISSITDKTIELRHFLYTEEYESNTTHMIYTPFWLEYYL